MLTTQVRSCDLEYVLGGQHPDVCSCCCLVEVKCIVGYYRCGLWAHRWLGSLVVLEFGWTGNWTHLGHCFKRAFSDCSSQPRIFDADAILRRSVSSFHVAKLDRLSCCRVNNYGVLRCQDDTRQRKHTQKKKRRAARPRSRRNRR